MDKDIFDGPSRRRLMAKHGWKGFEDDKIFGPGGFDTPIHSIGGKGRWIWKGWGD